MTTEKCYYCERKFGVAIYGTNTVLKNTWDHIIPVSKGGKNNKANITYACHLCNGLKSNHSLIDFLQKVRERKEKSVYSDKNDQLFPFPVLERIYSNTQRLIESEGVSLYQPIRGIKTKKRKTESNVIWGGHNIELYVSKTDCNLNLEFQLHSFEKRQESYLSWLQKYNAEPEPNFHYE